MNKFLRTFIVIGIALVFWNLLQMATSALLSAGASQFVADLSQNNDVRLETNYSTTTGQPTGEDEGQSPPNINEVVYGNLSVIGSECVGTQCSENESFGFDTFKLKESNLRLFFEDASITSSFPSNDWRIGINDMNDGGDSYFAIEDATAGNVPFTIAAGAGQDALYVAENGKVGIGTAVPGSTLDISNNTGTTQVRIAENNAAPQERTLLALENNGAPQFQLMDNSSGDSWQIRMDAVGNLTVAALHTGTRLDLEENGSVFIGTSSQTNFIVDEFGNLTINGTLRQGVALNKEPAPEPVDLDNLTDSLANLTLYQYALQPAVNQDEASTYIRRLAPNAAEFNQLFGLGDGQEIDPLDAATIALGVAQNMHEVIQNQNAQITELESRLAALEALVESLTNGN